VYSTFNAPGEVNGTSITGINSSGEMIGFYLDAHFSEHPFVLIGGQYTPFDVPFPHIGLEISGLNDRGQIVGEYADSQNHLHAFLASPVP
jgi:hypothetical protein